MALVHLPAMLRPLAGGAETRSVPGATVAELVDNLEALHPGINARLVEEGRLRSGLRVFIAGEVRREGLESEVGADDEVYFIPALAGGAGPSRASGRETNGLGRGI